MASTVFKFWLCSIFTYLIFLMVTGLVLGGVTSYVLIESYGMRKLYDPIQTSIYFLYIPTIMIFITSGITWKAVKKKNITLLKCFSGLLAVIICLEIVGTIWNFLSLQILHEAALPVFEEKFNEVIQSQNSDIWDVMQRKLKCCGIHGAFDYKSLNIVPFSCCNQTASNNFPTFCKSVHHTGCLDAFTSNLSVKFAILATVAATVALFQIPGVFALWCFANKIKEMRSLERRKNSASTLLLNKSKISNTEGKLVQEIAQ